MAISNEDRQALIRDKYQGDTNTNLSEDEKRLACGEPLAYVIGWVPFLGLKIHLDLHPDSRPLIPRPETEWWTKKLIEHLREKFGATEGDGDGRGSAAPVRSFVFLDLCAGSGAIGLAVLKALPNAIVWFGEIDPKHVDQIRENAKANGLPLERIGIRESDLFNAFGHRRFHVIASNPPYIPENRKLEKSVADFEPKQALYAGKDGLLYIERILREAEDRLLPGGEVWIECDTANIETAQKIARSYEIPHTVIHQDQYSRPRLLVADFT